MIVLLFFFFFKQKTAYEMRISDWSSDVCSSDLNDAADAEAIVVAARRPEMRFVEPKSEAQQSAAILYRSRQRLVRQRTETVNALRAALYEFGHVIPDRTGVV